MKKHPIPKPHPFSSGVALIAVLSVLAACAVLFMVFMAIVSQDRKSTSSYSNSMRAEQVAQGAFDKIVNELQAELVAGSERVAAYPQAEPIPPGTRKISVYRPKLPVNQSPVSIRGTTPNAGALNLLRVSKFETGGEAAYLAKYYPSAQYDASLLQGVALASEINTVAEPSLNRRALSNSRWNRSQLIPTGEAFDTPDWILVSRNGPIHGTTSDLPALRNLTDLNNGRAVVGRYSYAIFNVGGLLDANVAGYPTGATEPGRKGSAAWADLISIGFTPTLQSQWINWRNPGDPAAYLDLVKTMAAKGYLQTLPGNNSFLSRSDLIEFASAKGLAAQLPLLTTFQRELNAPSFRHASAAQGPDFATALVNEKPLRRFPLSRLKLLEQDGSLSSNAASISEYFGLSPNSSGNHPNGFRFWNYQNSTIKTLDDVVRVERRAPNFFELLKAALNNESVGRGYKGTYLRVYPSNDGDPQSYGPDTISDDQIIRIGVNIIDQYDGDRWPTTIGFNGQNFYGIENLPYFSEMFVRSYRTQWTTQYASTHYFMFEMWNPHQSDSRSLPGPTRAEVWVNPASQAKYRSNYWMWNGNSVDAPWFTGYSFTFPSTGIDLGSLANYLEPALIVNPAHAASYRRIGGDGIGFNGYAFTMPQPPSAYGMGWANDRFSIDRTVFELRFYDLAGNPHTYSTFGGFSDWEIAASNRTQGQTGLQDTGAPIFVGHSTKTAYRPQLCLSKVDPRTFRFGVNAEIADDLGNRIGVATAPSDLPGMSFSSSTSCNSNYPGAGANPHYIAKLAANVAGQGLYTQDRDGVTRPGDAYLGTNSGQSFTTVNPMRTGNSAARPVVLDRPFRTVGELGYAFRDMPWKTLDLFSGQTADAGLLDVFCLEETEMVAGKIDINSRQTNGLKAVISGSVGNTASGSLPISAADAATLAAAIRDRVWSSAQPKPYFHLGEVITGTLSQQSVTTAMPSIKTQREAAIRALSSSCQTRTWNLLIDVVAQSGRYPANATRLRDFQVDGERRVWLHVAIDRFTGEVIDRQTEIVYE